jgi:hypothetical protein
VSSHNGIITGDNKTHEVSQSISVLLARNHIRLVVSHVVAKILVCGLHVKWWVGLGGGKLRIKVMFGIAVITKRALIRYLALITAQARKCV